MLIGRSVFPSPCGRSPRADEVMAFGRRTVTMSFSGLRPIFAIGGSAGAVCGSVEPRGLCGAPVGGFAETICGFLSRAGRSLPGAEARNSLSLRLRALRRLRTGFGGPIGQVVTPAAARCPKPLRQAVRLTATHRRKPPRPPVTARF